MCSIVTYKKKTKQTYRGLALAGNFNWKTVLASPYIGFGSHTHMFINLYIIHESCRGAVYSNHLHWPEPVVTVEHDSYA